MLRHLYRFAIRLHPAGFRNRFGGELLSIFDHQPGKMADLLLLCDALVSLARQWTMRPEFWSKTPLNSAPAVSDGIPSFSTLDPFRPRTSAVIHGMVLSITLFCITCFAIRYSWIHVLQVHIPEVQFDSYVNATSSPATLRGASGSKQSPPVAYPGESRLISEHLQVDVMPVEKESTTPSNFETASTPRALAMPIAHRHASRSALRLDAYIGTYVSVSPPMTVSITLDRDILTIRIAGQPKRTLSPVSTTKLGIDGTDGSWVEFIPDQQGRISQLKLVQDGQATTAQRR
jgi:hypothetical protein